MHHHVGEVVDDIGRGSGWSGILRGEAANVMRNFELDTSFFFARESIFSVFFFRMSFKTQHRTIQ